MLGMDGRALVQFKGELLHNETRLLLWKKTSKVHDDKRKIRPLQTLIAFDIRPLMAHRAALLISCSKEEDGTIHERARLEHRGISSYVLSILMRSVDYEEKLVAASPGVHALRRVLSRIPIRPPGPRTTLLLRCSREESERIRRAARLRDTTISGFVLHSLHRSWNMVDRTIQG